MTSVPPLWFSRTFNFPYPAELLPNLLSRLRGAPARLDELFAGASPAARIAKPGGKWSAQEHAGHLLDLESLWRTRLNDFFSGANPHLTPADLTNRATDDANFNAQHIETILEKFRAARNALLAEVDARDIAHESKTLEHPRMKAPMRAIDHLFFVAEHDDHHLAKIYELLQVGVREINFRARG